MYNYIKLSLIAFMALCMTNVRAIEADSVTCFDVPTSLQMQMLDRQVEVPTGIGLLPKNSFSYNSLSFVHERGKMMRIQMPEKAKNVCLHSVGLYYAGNWQLYGEFAYSRMYEDSVQWLLSEIPEDGLPYYFATPKKGNWERERYDLKGILNWNITKSFVAGASVKIKYQKGARSNDPRPVTESFFSNYYLFGGITATHLSVLVSGGIGYGTRDNDLVYNNPDNDKPLRYDMMAYELMGFGIQRKTQAYQNRSLESNIYTSHIALQLQGSIDRLSLWGRICYDIRRDSIRRSRVTNVERSLLSTYHVNKLTVEVATDYVFSRKMKLSVQTYAHLDKGYDKLANILQGQKNYVYDYRRMGLDAILYTNKGNLVSNQYGISGGYEYEKKQDGSTEHVFERCGFDVSFIWQRRQSLCSDYQLFYGINQSFVFPTAELNYPSTQENVFSTNIAVPLVNYYHTSRGLTGLNIGGGKVFGRYQLSVSFTYSMAYALVKTYNIKGMRHKFNTAIIFCF